MIENIDNYIKEIKIKLLKGSIPESDFLDIAKRLLLKKSENKEVQALIVLMITKVKNMAIVGNLLYLDGFSQMKFYRNMEENSDSATYHYDIEDSMSEIIDIPLDLMEFISHYITETDYYLDLEETYWNVSDSIDKIKAKWHSNEIKYSNDTSIRFDYGPYGDEYWFDQNNNQWSTSLFTEEEAFNHSKTLINCTECRDCYNCIGSTLLRDCSECINCLWCHSSKDCINSEGLNS